MAPEQACKAVENHSHPFHEKHPCLELYDLVKIWASESGLLNLIWEAEHFTPQSVSCDIFSQWDVLQRYRSSALGWNKWSRPGWSLSELQSSWQLREMSLVARPLVERVLISLLWTMTPHLRWFVIHSASMTSGGISAPKNIPPVHLLALYEGSSFQRAPGVKIAHYCLCSDESHQGACSYVTRSWEKVMLSCRDISILDSPAQDINSEVHISRDLYAGWSAGFCIKKGQEGLVIGVESVKWNPLDMMTWLPWTSCLLPFHLRKLRATLRLKPFCRLKPSFKTLFTILFLESDKTIILFYNDSGHESKSVEQYI